MCGRKKASVVEAAVREASGTPPPPPCTYPRRARTRGRYIRRFDPGRTDRRNASTDGNARRGGRVPSPTPTHRSRHDPCGPCPRRYFTDQSWILGNDHHNGPSHIIGHRAHHASLPAHCPLCSLCSIVYPAREHKFSVSSRTSCQPTACTLFFCVSGKGTQVLRPYVVHVYPARERKFSVRMLFMCIRQGNASSRPYVVVFSPHQHHSSA